MINICVYAFVILNLFDGCLARVGITPLGAGCRNLDFECFDGKCIPYNQVCDGLPDCSDGADEKLCNRLDDDSALVDFIGRDKRQTTRKCGSGKWQCKDGTCIAVDEKCDGQVNCKDGTDESFATCRLGKCPSYLFRCAYGACVDGTAKCNGVQECRDNSDELHLDCLPKPTSKKCGVKFQCNSGECIPPYERCDGVADCEDGSDETVTQCGGNKCSSYLFRCAYGACVDGGSDCNTVIDCADGSDENYELCGTEPPTTTTTTTTTTTQKPTRTKQPTKPPVIQPTGNNCVTPPYSAGSYFVQPDNAYGANEEVPEFTTIIFDCGSSASLPGGLNFTVCLGGQWTTEPLCKRKCRPLNSLTVTYVCKDTEGRVVDCSAPVEQGTTAIPTCKPSYVAANVLPAMECLEGGSWDNSVSCTPDCGTITPKAQTLIVNGRTADRGEFPWHVGIFEVSEDDPSGYTNICGGSIVNAALVISAAHCFYVDGAGVKPAERYAVAAGKMYRSWDSQLDDPLSVQKSKVSSISIPEYYGGITRHYQADLAVLVLATYLQFSSLVRPICLSFDGRLEQLQLIKGGAGKVAGWGLLAEDGKPSEVLKTAELPYVPYPECVDSLPVTFQPFLLTDKICAGWTNGTAVCKGDSGGGLVFPRTDQSSISRYYLRGLVSNSPLNDAKTSCRSDNYAAFTKVSVYSEFINEIWSRHQPR